MTTTRRSRYIVPTPRNTTMFYSTTVLPSRAMRPVEAQAIMDELHLTQHDVALLIGVYQSTVSRWLGQERTRPVPEYLALILRILRDFPAVRERVIGERGGGLPFE